MLESTPAEKAYLDWLESQGYAAALLMPGNLWCGIKPLLFHWTLHTGEVGDKFSYLDRFCYADFPRALAALAEWSGRDFEGEPTGWRRHPATGRRRNDDGDPASEQVDWEHRTRGQA